MIVPDYFLRLTVTKTKSLPASRIGTKLSSFRLGLKLPLAKIRRSRVLITTNTGQRNKCGIKRRLRCRYGRVAPSVTNLISYFPLLWQQTNFDTRRYPFGLSGNKRRIIVESIAEDRENVPNLHVLIPKLETYWNLCIAPCEAPVWKQLAAGANGVKAGITLGLDGKKKKKKINKSRNKDSYPSEQKSARSSGWGESNRKYSSADEQAKVSNQPSVGRRVAI